jgi:hypothetical protein
MPLCLLHLCPVLQDHEHSWGNGSAVITMLALASRSRRLMSYVKSLPLASGSVGSVLSTCCIRMGGITGQSMIKYTMSRGIRADVIFKVSILKMSTFMS